MSDELADHRVGNGLRELEDRSIGIKGTVLEESGRTAITVEDCNVLQ